MTRAGFYSAMLLPGRIDAVSLVDGRWIENIKFAEARRDCVRFIVDSSSHVQDLFGSELIVSNGPELHLQFNYESIADTWRKPWQ